MNNTNLQITKLNLSQNYDERIQREMETLENVIVFFYPIYDFGIELNLNANPNGRVIL